MKKIIFLYLLFTFNFIFSQHSNNKNLGNISIEKLNSKVDSLILEQNKSKEKILENRIIQATETISNQNAVISSFGTLYTIISIILALLGIALPILTYQFGVKPSREALKEFEENVEKKFTKYFRNRNLNETNSAIQNLESNDIQIKKSALNFLTLNNHQGFINEQILKILEIVKKSEDENLTNQLLHCISNTRDENVKIFYLNYLENNRKLDTKTYYCIKYLSFYNYEDYKKQLKSFITNNDDYVAFNIVSSYLSSSSKNDFIIFLNDKSIIDNLSEKSLSALHQSDFGKSENKYWKLSNEEYEKTYLYEKLKNAYS